MAATLRARLRTGAYALSVAAAVVLGVALALYGSGRGGSELESKPVPDVVRFGRALELCTQQASASMKPLGEDLRFERGEWLVDARAWSERDAKARAAAAEWASTCLLRLQPVAVLDRETGRALPTRSSQRGYRGGD